MVISHEILTTSSHDGASPARHGRTAPDGGSASSTGAVHAMPPAAIEKPSRLIAASMRGPGDRTAPSSPAAPHPGGHAPRDTRAHARRRARGDRSPSGGRLPEQPSI